MYTQYKFGLVYTTLKMHQIFVRFLKMDIK
uniref:Uncharacterized protein n=1 Tax=Anguilla anguilla TaxID=7936 RepID=A0A0E9PI86_ANGAN